MKAITPCLMQYQSLLNCCCGKKSDILHLYYKLKWLREEIEKRSSYLGKFRKTEQAQHLLDLLAMTKDEEDLFYPFAKAAMADVFDALHSRTPEIEKAYLFNEGKNTVTITAVPQLNIKQAICRSTNLVYPDKIELEIELIADAGIDLSAYTATLEINIPYQVYYATLGTPSTIINQDRTISAISTSFTDTNNGYIVTFLVPISLASQTDDFSQEYLRKVNWNNGDDITDRIINNIVKANTPETYSKNDYVMIGNNLYIADADGDNNDITPLQKQPGDYRESIHYVMQFPDNLNKNMIEPLDTAVFEALVNRIIYKWLLLSYPDEAEIYLANYNEAVQHIYNRFVPKNPIVYRTPRII